MIDTGGRGGRLAVLAAGGGMAGRRGRRDRAGSGDGWTEGGGGRLAGGKGAVRPGAGLAGARGAGGGRHGGTARSGLCIGALPDTLLATTRVRHGRGVSLVGIERVQQCNRCQLRHSSSQRRGCGRGPVFSAPVPFIVSTRGVQTAPPPRALHVFVSQHKPSSIFIFHFGVHISEETHGLQVLSVPAPEPLRNFPS